MTINDNGETSHDWRLVERRDGVRKSVSSTRAGWGEARKSWRGQISRDTALVQNLSEGGIRLIGPRRAGVTAGSEIEIEVGGMVGDVTVRYVDDDPFDHEMRVYGVQVAEADEDLRQAIRARMEEEPTALEWVWEHHGQTSGGGAEV